MENAGFRIDILDLYWVTGEKDDPDDYCLHGDVSVQIDEEVVADHYSCTVSSTGLYLLKSLENDHLRGESANQMLPCCGHFIIPSATDDTVEITGCPEGVDWSVLHRDGYVRLVTESGNEVDIDPDEYQEIVFAFVDKIEAYYQSCTPKALPTDPFDRDGYQKFWLEWHRRRGRG